jgi:class 3 adenylate cyclase
VVSPRKRKKKVVKDKEGKDGKEKKEKKSSKKKGGTLRGSMEDIVDEKDSSAAATPAKDDHDDDNNDDDDDNDNNSTKNNNNNNDANHNGDLDDNDANDLDDVFSHPRRTSHPAIPTSTASPILVARSNSGHAAPGSDSANKRRSITMLSRWTTASQSFISGALGSGGSGGNGGDGGGSTSGSGIMASASGSHIVNADGTPATTWQEERAALIQQVTALQKELERERKERLAADALCAKLKTQLNTLKARTGGATPVGLKKTKLTKEEQQAVEQQALAELYLKHVELRNKFWEVVPLASSPSSLSEVPEAEAECTPDLLAALRSYVSHLVVRRLAADANALAVKKLPIIERYESTVVFADISGFTPLTERMAAKGREGVEKLTGFLNQFFGELVSIVHEFGGDIVKFAGDAVLAHWPSAPEAVMHEALQACQCSLALQSRLHNFKVEGGVLTLHVGVATGRVAGIYVGGEQGHIEFLLSGEALDLVSKCEKDASPGQTCISPSTYKLVEAHVKAHIPKGLTNYLLDSFVHQVPSPEPIKVAATALIAKPLRSFLAPAVAQRLKKGETGQTVKFLAELRTVSVLFVSLQIAFHGDDNDVPKVQDAVVAMQRTIFRYAGTLRQFIVDDKGSVLIAAWGLPPLAHEDDPRRAVLAALEISETLFKLGIMTSVGVTTGQTFCGDVGSAERREYAVVGDVVNLSARLMAHSNVGVLCDADTYKASVDSIEYVELAPIRVKGKKAPIPVYKPRSAKLVDPTKQSKRNASAVHQISLIARQREIGVLDATVQSLMRVLPSADYQKLPPASILIVQAQPGMGKTRLLAELRFMYLQAQPAAADSAGGASAASAADSAADAEHIAQLQAQIDEAVASKNIDRAVDLRDDLQALKASRRTGLYLTGQGSSINMSIRYHAWASIIETLVRARTDSRAGAGGGR